MSIFSAKKIPQIIVAGLSRNGLLNWINDKAYLELRYWIELNERLNLKNPQTYCEKLQWLKLNDRKEIYTTMADKYAVKDFVAKTIGNQYVVPNYAVWDSIDEVDFDILPEQFVIKCSHDSGGLAICKNKASFSKENAIKKLQKAFHNNGYWYGREWPYKNIQPKIIAEKFLDDGSGIDLKDYKVMCFEGKAKLIQVHQDRYTYKDGKRCNTQDFYDTEWNKTDIWQWTNTSEKPMPKPVFLEEMIQLSEKLSTGLHHLRVDWYYVNGQLYLGELTFFDASGFEDFRPKKWNKILGDWILIP